MGSGVEMIKIPPGPREFGPFGSALEVSASMLRFLPKMASYGDVSRFHIGNIPLTVISHPDLIREVLVTQAKDFHKSAAFDRLKPLLGAGLLTSEDEFHHRQRRLAAPAFHHQRIAHYAETMIDFAGRTSARWQPGQQVDMAAEMMRLTLAEASGVPVQEVYAAALMAGRAVL